MRRIARTELDPAMAEALARRQASMGRRLPLTGSAIANEWNKARRTKVVQHAIDLLKQMAGPAERCMYCVDSHGSDVEHFWPKAPFPERMFQWDNLLWACAECGRFKADKFPLDAGQPLLIDPTRSDPWLDLDFDPVTGNLTPRYQPEIGNWSRRGEQTVKVLHLDRREALATVYLRTFARLRKLVQRCIDGDIAEDQLAGELQAQDDHGLLAWCFGPTGPADSPFRDLRRDHKAAWRACAAAAGYPESS